MPDAIPSGIWAKFSGKKNLEILTAINATTTPVNATTSSYQTNFVVGVLILWTYFIDLKKSIIGFICFTLDSSKTALTALLTAQDSNKILAIKITASIS